jgi:hypothetical protein
LAGGRSKSILFYDAAHQRPPFVLGQRPRQLRERDEEMS